MTVPRYIEPVKDQYTWYGKRQGSAENNPYPWSFRCPAPFCFYCILAPDEAKLDERIEKHPCPWFGGGTTTYSWGIMSDSYIGPIWKKLDDQVDIVKGGGAADRTDDQIRMDMQQARYTARGLAEALAVLMPPFFLTANDIVKESIRRWEKRQAGEDYETPGMGRLKWKKSDLTPDHESWLTQEHDHTKPRPAVPVAAKPKHSLPDGTVDIIKRSKNFPVEILATAYGVTPEVIQSIWDS